MTLPGGRELFIERDDELARALSPTGCVLSAMALTRNCQHPDTRVFPVRWDLLGHRTIDVKQAVDQLVEVSAVNYVVWRRRAAGRSQG